MQAFSHSAAAVMLILLMTAVGCFCGRMGWMKREHKAFLVKYIMNIALPCMCISGLMGKVSHALLFQMRMVLLVSVCALCVLFALAFLLGRLLRLPPKKLGVFVVMCFVANSMFIGYPMCTALFGDAAVPVVLTYYIVNTLAFQTVGVAFLNYGGAQTQKRSFGALIKAFIKPPLYVIAVCVILILCDVTLPKLVLDFAGYMGNTVSPIALLYTGFVIYELYETKKASPQTRKDSPAVTLSLLLVLLFRFVLAPVCCVLFCRLFGMEGSIKSILMIEIAMPVMTQVVVLSAECGADESYAALGMTLSTIACFVSVPILMLFV